MGRIPKTASFNHSYGIGTQFAGLDIELCLPILALYFGSSLVLLKNTSCKYNRQSSQKHNKKKPLKAEAREAFKI